METQTRLSHHNLFRRRILSLIYIYIYIHIYICVCVCVYIYIYICVCVCVCVCMYLAWFYSISTIVSYLMSSPILSYILNIIC